MIIMTAKEETIRVSGLSTGYRNKGETAVVTHGINASLYSGELTCLLGPNGAGKSTLLRTLTAFLPPVAGEIFIESNPLKDYSPAEISRMIGVVLTDRLNVSNMSVEELIGLGRSPYTGFWGRLSVDDRKIVDEAINLVGVGMLRKRMVHTLSDGERQKVMIAKTLAQETPIIFLDEPTAFLDYPSKVEIMQLLRQLAYGKNKTVFLSTHDMELALQIADRIWLIDKTHGVTTGTPEDLAINGALSKYFLREGILFDIDSGLFRIDNRMERSVALSGNGPIYNMVMKALTRKGISAIAPTGDDSLHHITASDGSGLTLDGTEYLSIGDLIDSLENILYLEKLASARS